jgi:hypothetical protein
MAFSCLNAQGVGHWTEHAPHFNVEGADARANALSAIVRAAAPVGPMLIRHRHAAFPAELPVMGLHAFRYFRYVRDEIGTKPHGVGRAGITRFRTALRGGQAYSRDPDDDKSDRQDRSANKMYKTQHIFASFPY